MNLYKAIFKPILFKLDAEFVHDCATHIGGFLGQSDILLGIISKNFRYDSPKLSKTVLGVDFKNPVGIAAGFDYNGKMANVFESFGFGFNTIGTVTAKPYEGNPKPRLKRLPKSQALLVNKGFKSLGADMVEKILDSQTYSGKTLGLSVGSSNLPEVNTIDLAIEDYVYTFLKFKNKDYIKYFELNISCPNTSMLESFTDLTNYTNLLKRVKDLNIEKPIFVKMPNELDIEKTSELVKISLTYNIKGFIFSNLVKDRTNPLIDKQEMQSIQSVKGNISGKPTEPNSTKLIAEIRKRFGSEISIIGCGGIFTPEDAKNKLDAGADLVQLITGMIYEGPIIAKKICASIEHND